MDSPISETLFICRSVNVYTIPSRPGGGHKSGTWRVEDKIFSGRLRVVATGSTCTIILEEDSGKEFASCPIPEGEREQAVEPVTDSSRYFVLRLLAPDNPQRRAFVGLGFDDRSEAFDFNVSLSDHEKHVRRAKDTAAAARTPPDPSSGVEPSSISTEAAKLYQSRDLSLKEGETMKINFKRPGSGRGTSTSSGPGNLAIPLTTPKLQMPTMTQPPPAMPQSKQHADTSSDLLGLSTPSVTDAGQQKTGQDSWATF